MNVRQEAWSIIVKVLKNNMFSDKLLSQTAKKIKDSNENSDLLYYLVRGVIKIHLQLDFIISQYVDKDKYKDTDLKIKSLLYLAMYQLLYCKGIPEHAAVNETVEIARKNFNDQIAGFVNAVLREYQRNPKYILPDSDAERISVEYSFPLDIIKKLLQHWSIDQVECLCMYFNEPPKLYMRINSLATSKQKLINYFQRKEVILKESIASQNVVISENADKVLNDVSFDEGYFTIQDISAVMAIELLDPKEGEYILDLFAGRGGKTSYIAELMNNTGEIIAVDKIPHKIKEMKQTLSRVQATNVKLEIEDAFKFGPVAPVYDRVIIDVPCSGWGVFQKKPELRWQERQNLPELIKLQEKALHTASSFVKPGGILFYSTCTINPDENEEQIFKFLKQNQEYELIPAESILSKEFTENGFLKTIPHKHFMDGAFAAKLRKYDKQ
ncbi:MAG: 16S rRNA (cytosine(967)-C(5))-methyltransferase RsmB [Candidatus Cloacimonetes bacterium]|nr:16S rRNA (cytosine(967)-C(5))-methyltransferase RsmB [Candidatus Cloacimonadota bacterium]